MALQALSPAVIVKHGSATGGAPPATCLRSPGLRPSLRARLLLALEPQEGCWIPELKNYLMQGTLPENEEEAERVAR